MSCYVSLMVIASIFVLAFAIPLSLSELGIGPPLEEVWKLDCPRTNFLIGTAFGTAYFLGGLIGWVTKRRKK